MQGVSVVADKIVSMTLSTLDGLISACIALGAEEVPGWTSRESALAKRSMKVPPKVVRELREQIAEGQDPLGDALSRLRSPEERRPQGQTFTPPALVKPMVVWSRTQPEPIRVVDPGVGSARYLLAAGREYPKAQLVGADLDPLATLLARANLNAAGLGKHAVIELRDYRQLKLPKVDGPTFYVGNPPYVRHHGISAEWKQWLTATAGKYGYKASQLAGLHVHFFLATLEHASAGDYGAFVTSSEWLDVNYGSIVRQLLLDGLGGNSIHVLSPASTPFADATTTAAITSFRVGARVASIRLHDVKNAADLGTLKGGREVSRDRLVQAPRWTPLLRSTPKLPEGYVELGEIARVHRGTVTGANRVWVTRRDVTALPDEVLHASVTRARELFSAGEVLVDDSELRLVIDIPVDLDVLSPESRLQVEKWLRQPHVREAKHGYIARSRKAWWSVGLRPPAPILATYMARRPPAFVRNAAGARHINIAHGIYPRIPLSEGALARLLSHLRVSVTTGQGRTYAGGLTKFEPREMERLPVPSPELLTLET